MAVSEECARVLEVNASVVVRYEGDGSATIVWRHNRDGIDVFHSAGRALAAEIHSALGRVRRVGNARARGRLGRDSRTERRRRCSVAATARRRPRRSSWLGALWGAVAIGSEDPLPAGDGEPPRRVLRAGVAGGRERAGARGPHRVARASRGWWATSSAGDWSATSTTARSRSLVSVALKLRLARARRGAGPRRGDAAARGRDARARHGPGGAARIARGIHPAILSERGAACAGGALPSGCCCRWSWPPRPSGSRTTARRRRTTSSPRADERARARRCDQRARVGAAGGRHAALRGVRQRARGRRSQQVGPGSGGCATGRRRRGTLSVVSPPGRGTVVAAAAPL